MADNPRIDELRKRLEREPGSRFFAQLAEELRKEGELGEAIEVARAGLQAHPNYPSARMTLGRALLDTGDLAAARTEFEAVLRGAPDNIFASRYLAECLEGLGDLEGALLRFRATLLLAPADKQLMAHVLGLEDRLKSPAPPAPAGAASEPAGTEPPPIPVSEFEGPFELERPTEAATLPKQAAPFMADAAEGPRDPASAEKPGAAPEPPPIPVAIGDETFELEQPYEASSARWTSGEETVVAAPIVEDAGGGASFEESFEVERTYDAPASAGALPTAARGPGPTQDRAAAPPPSPAPPAQVPPPLPGTGPRAAEAASPVAPGRAERSAPRGEHGGGPVFRPRPPVPGEAPPRPPAAPPYVAPSRPTTGAPPLSGTRGRGPAPAATAPNVPAPPTPRPPAPVSPPPPPVPQAAQAAPPPRDTASEPPEPDASAGAPGAGEADLTSSTLAELYFNQGFTDKAIDVYRQLVQREPENERARARLTELTAIHQHLEAAAGALPARSGEEQDPRAARRRAVERAIAQLERLLEALRKE